MLFGNLEIWFLPSGWPMIGSRFLSQEDVYLKDMRCFRKEVSNFAIFTT